MKTNIAVKIVFTLIFIAFGISVSFGQLLPRYYWRTIPSPVASNLKGLNENLIVGENGTILNKTAVNSYTLISGIPNYIFNSVSSNSNVLNTIVGNNGIIYYCSSGSYTTWTLQTSGTTANLNSVLFITTRNPLFTRITVGNGGTILKSTTGYPVNWTPWAPVTSNTMQNLNAVISLDTSNLLIVGDSGTILRSTNKGNDWSLINSGFTNKLNSVYFAPNNSLQVCWITGDNGLILKSTNAGLNWIQIPSGTTANLKSFAQYFICGSNGVVLRSLDSGMTWSATQTLIQTDLNAITGPHSGGVYPVIIAGNAGKILKWDIDSSFVFRKLDGNSISSYFVFSGIFNNNINNYLHPGFEWPKGSGMFAIYSSGLCISAMVQGQIRQAMASYKGELTPGICSNGIPFTNDTFKVYTVSRTDSPGSNNDWSNWGLMVPYGAPFVDVNNNGIYERLIDTPGVKNASQTVFICMTDGFTNTHNIGDEGFGGGTLPLYNEMHLTAWCYSQNLYTDMQFLKYDIINKGNNPWTRTYFSFVADPDVGNGDDDYIGCDTVRKLGYCYNADNDDLVYGVNPPAVGFIILKGAYRKYVNPGFLGMTGFTYFGRLESGFNVCEFVPGDPRGAYYYMMGYKKDSTSWLDPTQSPKKKTKFIYPGDPETNTGWTEYKGRILNCLNDTTGQIFTVNPSGDRKFVLSSGSDEITVMPGDTQRIVMCQLIARGTSNLNSVTKLKQLSDVATQFYNTNFTIGINQISTEIPSAYSLHQNYPNPFNPLTKIRYELPKNGFVKLAVFDVLGREVVTLIDEKQSAGTYEATFDGSAFPSGVYFYRLTANSYTETKKLLLIK